MNKITIILIIVIIILIGFGGYFFLQNQGQAVPEQNQQQTQNTQQPAPETNTTVSIQNFSFNPSTITIQTGTTVIWTNNDPVTHRIKSDTFNSDNLNQGDSFQFKFENAGTYDYSCAIHPSMTGKIIVE